MPKKVGTGQDPALSLDFFLSGFYTYRSQLFAPFRAIGITVVSFHDPVIDGANMEDTDKYEWQRRPGFAKYCSVQLGGTEVVNQFYSARKLTGQLFSYFDSTTRFASFNTTAIDTIISKNTSAQGYPLTIGNMTYFSDGNASDMLKIDKIGNVSAWGLPAPTITPTITNRGCWLPSTLFSTIGNGQSAILDPNGCVEIVTATYSGTSSGRTGLNEPLWATTTSATTSDGQLQWTNSGFLESWFPETVFPLPVVITDTNGNLQYSNTLVQPVIPWNAGVLSNISQVYSYEGDLWVCTYQNTGIAPNSNTVTTVTAGATATTQSYWAPATSPNVTGIDVPTWNTALGGTTTDGNFIWTNIGPGGLVESFGTSYVYAYRTIYGHLSTASPISVNTGSIFGPVSASITSYAIVFGGGHYTVTFQGVNNFQPLDTFTVQGLTTPVGLLLNGQTFVVQALGTTTAAFVARTTVAVAIGSTNDTGSTVNQVAQVSGVGTGSPLCNATAAITSSFVSADIVTLYATNSFVPGLYVTFSGLIAATFLNGQQLQIINVDPNGTWFQVYYMTANQSQTSDAGTATFNAIEVYRVSDGGGIYLFSYAVTNPGAGVTWTLNDFTTDSDLNILQIAPQNDLNDPPPGAPGSSSIPSAPGSNIINPGTITAYWQGRIWMVSGNYVYFDAGPDCTNGVPEESWPPANRFQYAGAPLALVPTADGVGLLVYLSDRVNVILGGPETISFYTTDAFSNFGIDNPNAIFRDGSTIGQFTTQDQYFELIEKNKVDTGEHIADYLAANFDAASTYVTMHRDGLDVGVFISNGVDQVLRFGTNIGAWSVPAYPVGGAGALRSIETSVGQFSLMLAPPTGGGYLLARDLTTWQDNGQNYEDCYVTIGSITLSQPGAEMFPLQHVVGYFDAVGTLGAGGGPSYPNVWILPNEVSGDSGIGFIELPEVVQEPPIGQNVPSSTLLALRWPCNMMNSSLASQFVHHLQVRVEFSPENAANTIKAMSFKQLQD